MELPHSLLSLIFQTMIQQMWSSIECVRRIFCVLLVNPPRMRRRVTVVGSVCVSVCLLSQISPLEHLFALKILSRTQRTTKVKKFVGFSLKPFHCRDPALPPLKAIRTVGHFPTESTHTHYSIYHVVSGLCGVIVSCGLSTMA